MTIRIASVIVTSLALLGGCADLMGRSVVAPDWFEAKAEEVKALGGEFEYDKVSQTLCAERQPIQPVVGEPVAIVTAGTSDIPVAQEAAETLRLCGVQTRHVFDVGVAGLHRLLARVPELQRAPAVIVVAGMEGALPSVVGGLLGSPVIAVPTSVGYGASLGGLTALLGMLSSCASGVTVVNIDNGFGAAMAGMRQLNSQRLEGPPRGE